MFLRRVTIDNYSCFKQFDVQLAEGINVIIGRNGAGKTSLIKSLVYLMNFMFTNDRSMGDHFLSAGNPDLKMTSIKQDEFYRFNANSEAVSYANFHGEMTFEGEDISWDMYKKSIFGASLYPSKYVDAYRKLMEMSTRTGRLPLLAYFSDSFPHKQTNISSFARNEISKTTDILRNFGYYQWDNETACTVIWQMRLLNVMAKSMSLKETNSAAVKENSYVLNTLKLFSRTINIDGDNSFEIDTLMLDYNGAEKLELWVKLKSGQEIPFEALPAGYHRLYSIVLDLAYRSYLLNRNNPDETTGLVLIDEVDLHLHPSLSIEVLERFRAVFPAIQFVVTTHSPLIITSLKSDEHKNQVLRLVSGENKPHVLPDLYGIDYNAGLVDVMGINPTNEDVDYLKRAIIRAARRGDSANRKLKETELKGLLSESTFKKIIADINKEI
ncbi:AAA family ATPase [Hoylesella shahii]